MNLQPLVTRLTARWIEALPDESTSTAVSGLGAWPLLALLAGTAGGPARDELARAVGLDPRTSAAAGAALISQLAESEDLGAALGLWAQQSVPLAPDFAALVPAANRGVLTGDAAQDRKLLDDWVVDHTHGLLDRMPLETGPELLLALATALTVRTEWRAPFDEHTRESSFGSLERRRIQWLGRELFDLGWVHRHDQPAGPLTVITIDGSHDVDVLLAIGAEGRSRNDVLVSALDSLTATGTSGDLLIEADVSAEVSPAVTVERITEPEPMAMVTLPAFELSVTHDLLEHADVFGLSTATDAAAGHFPGISTTPLAVNQARQSVLARFFATGFEAAAVTAVGAWMGGAAPPRPESKALRAQLDRPFGFVAVHRPSRLPIVAGWVGAESVVTA